jgi:HEAT repeat protein
VDHGSVDPLFQQEEPVERPVRRGTLVLQFFLVPLSIVVVAVGVYLFFHMLVGGRDTPREYLQAVTSGGDNAQKQAAHQLAVLIAQERVRIDRGEDPGRPPFWQEQGFREDLRRAFVSSFPQESVERRMFLALALGQVGDPAFLPTLRDHVGETVGGEPNDPQVRRAVVEAIGRLRGHDGVPVLASLVSDPDEPVRHHAVVALSRHDTPASREALARALSDRSTYVQADAGAALARMGDPAGTEWVRLLLDPAEVQRMIATPTPGREGAASGDTAELRRAYLANGIRGALGLADESLRGRVEALTEDGDPHIRDLARRTLEQWPKT